MITVASYSLQYEWRHYCGFQITVVKIENLVYPSAINGRIVGACLSLSRVELGGTKDCHVWNIIRH